ncbi:shikimate kinase [Marilutibacter spongiae]|uniref:Shikimate kinase n=1 Tax=Marilutibacter spongiae TaxID=2025720 RepID=A0A7W3TKJ6_9GAMM|nr:shikimate kinase [Lysobacter spongiae]MBB1060055.1 shikimate kinase [Lysobacter spongiae]
MNPARNLILVGPTGAGKTHLGPPLAAHFGLRLLDLDAAVEADTGMRVAALFEREGEAGFRAREHAMLHALLEDGDIVLVTGGGAVLDPRNRERMRTRGFVVHLQATPAQQLARLQGDRSRPLLARADRASVLEAMARVRTPLYAEVADLAFDTGRFDAGDAATGLINALEPLWKRNGVPA